MADNVFIINGLAERLLGKYLNLCFTGFSKAFDVVNRNSIFYKLERTRWRGKTIDTPRSPYTRKQVSVCAKMVGLVPQCAMLCSVNYGSVASGLLFRKYMADLHVSLNTEFVMWVGKMIIAHILCADDLILTSDSPEGLQHQIYGLVRFCTKISC